jgi:hypothetical protein
MLGRAFTLVAIGLASPNVFAAGINLQVYGGSRTTDFKPVDTSLGDEEEGASSPSSSSSDDSLEISDRFSGYEYGFASLAQPVKEVPVALGVFAMQQQFKGKNSDYNEKLGGIMAGLDAMAWISAGIWQPFARVGYDLYSRHRYSMSYDEQSVFGAQGSTTPTRMELEGRVRGYHGAVGARVKPTPFVGAFLQLDFADEEFQVDRASVIQDGFGFTVTSDDLPKVKLRSRSVMLGVDLGT